MEFALCAFVPTTPVPHAQSVAVDRVQVSGCASFSIDAALTIPFVAQRIRGDLPQPLIAAMEDPGQRTITCPCMVECRAHA